MDPEELDADPLRQLAVWFDEAVASGLHDATAMVLSTTGADGRPRGRHVLLKGLGADGLRFFTSYDSTKASQLSENPHASVTFPWFMMTPPRQVIVEGAVERLDAADSDVYFATRDRGSQIGAWASAQSTEIPDRAWLERRVAEFEARFPDEIPRPPRWGGYCLRPEVVELWQGRANRLHDRVRYTRQPDEPWLRARLAP
ncbi:MAG: pyridoxamine 5'-phosphate oxidase [Acidimicrobiales bacterium]